MKVGKFYRGIHSKNVCECLASSKEWAVILYKNGSSPVVIPSYHFGHYQEYTEPKVFTGYALVYPFGWNSAKFAVGNLHGSLEEMDSCHKEDDINLGKALAKIKITFTEGEGL